MDDRSTAHAVPSGCLRIPRGTPKQTPTSFEGGSGCSACDRYRGALRLSFAPLTSSLHEYGDLRTEVQEVGEDAPMPGHVDSLIGLIRKAISFGRRLLRLRARPMTRAIRDACAKSRSTSGRDARPGCCPRRTPAPAWPCCVHRQRAHLWSSPCHRRTTSTARWTSRRLAPGARAHRRK